VFEEAPGFRPGPRRSVHNSYYRLSAHSGLSLCTRARFADAMYQNQVWRMGYWGGGIMVQSDSINMS